MSTFTVTVSANKAKSLIVKLRIGNHHAAGQQGPQLAASIEAQGIPSVSDRLISCSDHTTNPYLNQAANIPARRQSTRIATAISSQSSTIPSVVSHAPTAHAAQHQPMLLKLLTHLGPDFTTADIHACEEAVLAAGGYVYLDIVVPYYQDAEARELGTTKGELDRTSALLEFQFGKEAGKAKFDLGMEHLRNEARDAGRS